MRGIRGILAVAFLLGLAVQPTQAQHTTGEGNPIDKSTAPVQPSAETTDNQAMGSQKSMTDATGQAVSGAQPGGAKGEGATCKSDAECGTGACKPAGESRVCVPK
jgi:hypothetical protein